MIYGNSISAAVCGHNALYQVTLPRSKYYAQTAEWETVSSVDALPSYACVQAAIAGELWCITESTISARSLTTGEISYTETNPLVALGRPYLYETSVGVYYPSCTDGERRIWFITVDVASCSYSGASASMRAYLNEYDVLSHQIKSYHIHTANATYYTTTGSSVNMLGGLRAGGVLIYSNVYNRVYYIGGSAYSNSSIQAMTNCYLDLTENAITTITSCPIKFIEGFGYEDPETGNLYFGGGILMSSASTSSGRSALNKTIYQYDILHNTYTAVRTDFITLSITNTGHAYIPMADKILEMSPTGVATFNPMTGETIEEQLPSVFTGTITPNMKACANNTLYAWVNENSGTITMKECRFFDNVPADAPIVCKIFKGQKYHTLVPFDIPRLNLSITRQQQTADQDYIIKMYDYSAEGGQIVYIET